MFIYYMICRASISPGVRGLHHCGRSSITVGVVIRSKCPCCPGAMKVKRPMLKPGEVEFFLKLHGLWEGLVRLPRPPPPPFDIETLRRIEPPWQAIKQWIPDQEPKLDWFNQPRGDREEYDQSADWQPKEVKLSDGRILLLDES